MFTVLAKIYGNLWIREHGESPSSDFNAWADSLNNEQAIRVVVRSRESLARGEQFPPALGCLSIWATQPTEIEFIQIRSRVMAGIYENEIEHWIVSKCLFNLKRVPEKNFLKSLRGFYSHATELEKHGKLFEDDHDLLALPCDVHVNVNDKTRNSFIPTENVKRAVNSRILRMRRSQQNQPQIESNDI